MDLQKVKTLIHDKKVNVNTLADDLQISRQSLYLKLNGARSFRAEELLKMAISLNMSPEEILNIFFNLEVTQTGHAEG